MSDERHEGWKNYETWAVALYIDNDRGELEDWIAAGVAVRDAFETDQLKEAFEAASEAAAEKMPETGPWVDLLSRAVGNVDWFELAGHYLSKAAERAAK